MDQPVKAPRQSFITSPASQHNAFAWRWRWKKSFWELMKADSQAMESASKLAEVRFVALIDWHAFN